jgi:hypothetical protein
MAWVIGLDPAIGRSVQGLQLVRKGSAPIPGDTDERAGVTPVIEAAELSGSS